MGVVDFDPEKWRQTNASEAPAGVAKVAKPAEVNADGAKLSQLSQLSQADPVPLPDVVGHGLVALRSMRTPRLLHPDRWPLVVSDALSLACDGWAAKAIALGWSPLDLFGVVPDSLGDPADDGLAVWLGGRRLIALCGTYAVVEYNDGGRSYYNRRQAAGAVLLWELGKAQC